MATATPKTKTKRAAVDERPDGVFTTAKRRAKPITFTLDDEDYVFTPPKRAGAVVDLVLSGEGVDELAATRAAFDWLSRGLPEEQNDRIVERLKDPEDDFDIENLEDLLQWLRKRVEGRPTS
jgi:hypothetical protein